MYTIIYNLLVYYNSTYMASNKSTAMKAYHLLGALERSDDANAVLGRCFLRADELYPAVGTCPRCYLWPGR